MSRVLIIEEDADSMGFIKRLLAEHGLEAAGFEDAAEGFEWLKRNRPELLIVGGGKYGEKAQQHLRMLESAEIKGAPIVLAVGREALERTRELFGRQVKSVIPVPPTAEEMTALIQAPAHATALDAT